MTSEFRMQRTLKNLTQRELGNLVDVSQTYINQLELLRVYKVSDATADKLEKVLGKDIDELLSFAK